VVIISQPRHHSLLESIVNVSVGYVVAVIATQTVLPFFGYHPTLNENLQISAIFTVISLVRSYVVRRVFNAISAHVPAPNWRSLFYTAQLPLSAWRCRRGVLRRALSSRHRLL
jgi:hypothetical protein